MSEKANVNLSDLSEFVYWARRYCDERKTYAASSFNLALERVMLENLTFKDYDSLDVTLKDKGKYWPWAADGDETVDARPLNHRS